MTNLSLCCKAPIESCCIDMDTSACGEWCTKCQKPTEPIQEDSKCTCNCQCNPNSIGSTVKHHCEHCVTPELVAELDNWRNDCQGHVEDGKPVSCGEECEPAKYGYGVKEMEQDLKTIDLPPINQDTLKKKLEYMNVSINGENIRLYRKENILNEAIAVVEKMKRANDGIERQWWNEDMSMVIFQLQALIHNSKE